MCRATYGVRDGVVQLYKLEPPCFVDRAIHADQNFLRIPEKSEAKMTEDTNNAMTSMVPARLGRNVNETCEFLSFSAELK